MNEDPTYSSMQDLFGRYRLVNPKGRPMSERATIIQFFVDQGFTWKNGLALYAKDMSIRLAHYKLDDLYALKSCYTDRFNRNGSVAAAKYFWFTTDTTYVVQR